MLEKEQFKAHIHRLARALKREREKTAATARRDLEQLKLEYVAREQRFILDGDRHELHKIKAELKALSEQDAIREEGVLHASATTGYQPRRDDPRPPPPRAVQLAAVPVAVTAAQVNTYSSPSGKKRSAQLESSKHSLSPFASPEDKRTYHEEPTSMQTPPPADEWRLNSPQPKKGTSAAEAEAEILRLESEKEELLSTGVFDESHPIITQIDRLMRVALQELANANDQ